MRRKGEARVALSRLPTLLGTYGMDESDEGRNREATEGVDGSDTIELATPTHAYKEWHDRRDMQQGL